MMVLSVLFLLLSVSLWATSGYDVCSGPARLFCQNVSTAESCNSLEKCLTYWKSARWVSVQTDLSAKCTYCLIPNSNAHLLCKISNTSSCTELINSWNVDNKNKDNSYAFCNVIGMCQSHNYLGDLNFGSPVCDDCKKIIQDVRVLVGDNATIAAITDKIESYVCGNTPQMFKDYCKETVRIHIPALIHTIEIHINPNDICSLFGLCKSDHLRVTLDDLLPSDPENLEVAKTHTKCPTDEKFSWINRPDTLKYPMWTSRDTLPKVPSGFLGKPSCGQCKEVLEQIRQTLNDPTIREDIKKEIDQKVCSTLPSFLKQACNNAVNVHFDDIINSLNQADLAEVCATFGMCVADSDCLNSRLPRSGAIQQTPLQPGIPVPGACQLCEVVLHKLMDMLVNNRTEASITAALEYICDIIPGAYKDRCQKFVVQYGAQIVEAIVEGTAPKIFCMTIGLCSERAVAAEVPVSGPLMLNYCDTCKIFITVVQQQIQQNQTVEGLEATIKRLCNVLPGSYGDECRTLVDLYLPVVVDYVAKSMSPEEICQEIKLCPSNIQLTGGALGDVSRTCQSQDLGAICSSLELAAMCGKLQACREYHQARYLSDAIQSSFTGSADCSLCSELVRRWRLSKDLYGRVLENGHSCEGYVNPDDRTLCLSIVDKRFAIQQKMMNSMLTVEDICKQSDSCVKNAPTNPVTKLTEIPHAALETMVHTCSMDYKTLCASQRLIELCGKAHICRAFGQNPTRQPVSVEGTSRLVNRCSLGPSFYCQTEERARLCGPDAVKRCKSLGFDITEPVVVSRTAPIVGRNRCSWGPAFWCSSEENAIFCDAVAHCRSMAEAKV